MSEIDRLRDRVAELEDAMGLTAEIPFELVPREIIPGQKFGKPILLAIIAILLARPFGNKAALFDVLYGSKPECDQPSPQILSVYVSRIRAALRLYGVELKTVKTPGLSGWYLDEANKAKLRDVIASLQTQRAAA